MHYEKVTLEEKNIVGLCARTSNLDPQMPIVIVRLWEKLFGTDYAEQISPKCSAYPIGLYSDYESDVSGKYDITVGFEVEPHAKVPAGAVHKMIPAGTYAKFYVEGDQKEAVGAFWQSLWQMNLPRTYTGDFEVYLPSDSPATSKVFIYIAIEPSAV